MKWTNSEDIAIALLEKFPGVDPLTVRFTDLRERVMQLDGFDDRAGRRDVRLLAEKHAGIGRHHRGQAAKGNPGRGALGRG